MLELLIKKQLLEINSSFFVNKKNGQKKSKVSTILSILGFGILLVVVLGGIFTYLANLLCVPFCSLGLDWCYFALMALISIVLGVFGSVFNTYATLYQAKDNEMLMVYPIPARIILISRLVAVYIMCLCYSAIVFIPTLIMHTIYYGFHVGPLVMFGNISLIVFFLSCLLGYGVAQITAHTKNRSLITVLSSLAFIAIYYYVYFNAVNSIQNIVSNPDILANGVKGFIPIVIFGKVGTGEIVPVVFVSGISIVLTILVFIVLEKNFFTLVQKSHTHTTNTKKAKSIVQKSVSRALLQKEFERFTSSASYMLNCALGSLMLVILGVVLLFRGQYMMDILQEVFEIDSIGSVMFIISSCMAIGMIDITAPSVSMEGKNLWIVRSLPIDTWQVLLAKLKVQWYISGIPFLFTWLCFLFVAKPSLLMMGFTFVIPFSFLLGNANLGLLMNLKKPNLTWVDEIHVIKQSFGVLASMLISVTLVIAMAAFYFIVGYLFTELYLLIWMLVLILFTIVLFLWLKKKGVLLFEKL